MVKRKPAKQAHVRKLKKPDRRVATAEHPNSLLIPFNALDGAGRDQAYTAELLRNQVNRLVESYHHVFDHFYECIQNSVDACEKAYSNYAMAGKGGEYSPQINIKINLPENTLTVFDNGTGMENRAVLSYFFTPYATLKATPPETVNQRGEKGVGATFLSYGSNYIHLSTYNSTEFTSGKLENGLKWCTGQIDVLPMPQITPDEIHAELFDVAHGTVITIKFTDDMQLPLLAEVGDTCDHWEAILKLHTAVGYIDFQNKNAFLSNLSVNLSVVNNEQAESSKSLLTGYLYPHLTTPANVQRSALVRTRGVLTEAQRDMDIMWEKFTEDQVSDFVTRRIGNLPHMRIRNRDRISRILREQTPEAYVAFAYTSEFWEEVNHRIWGTEKDGQLSHGIIYATKTQKVGEHQRIDFVYRSGDFNRFFILFSMKDLPSDIGRKSLGEDITFFANFFANSIQQEFVDNDDCLRPSPGHFGEGEEAELEQLLDRAWEKGDLGYPGLEFTKIPSEEQDVIALFFDLLGKELIRGYEIFSTHISRKYDGVGRFVLAEEERNLYTAANPLGIPRNKFREGFVRSPNRCFIEFKYSTDSLVRDYRAGYKRLQDIKWLVCWQIGDKHIEEGIGVISITDSAQINQRDYFGVTHLLTENQDKVYVICLQTVLELLDRPR